MSLLVSVCVPAFERAEYLSRLVSSFREQSHAAKELCISDDSRDDAVEAYVRGLQDPAIRYARNPRRRGLGPNLRHALEMAKGELAVVLGDDDALACPDALSCYAGAALRYPAARFFYANQLQIDAEDRVVFSHRYFSEESYFEPGTASLRGTWLRSVQIAGMGFRLSDDGLVPSLFPDEPSLFPQVVCVGHLVVRAGSVAIPQYVCSTRGHPMQLGAQAAQGKLVSSELEQQGGSELLGIVADLARAHPAEVGPLAASLERHIVVNFAGSMPNIRLNAGTPALRRLTGLMLEQSPYARCSVWLRALYVGLLVVPGPLLRTCVAILKRLHVLLRPPQPPTTHRT